MITIGPTGPRGFCDPYLCDGGFRTPFIAGHMYEMGEELTDANKGEVLILKGDNKVYKSTTANDKRVIGFLDKIR